MLPLNKPQRNRKKTATGKVGEKPNKIDAIIVPSKLYSIAFLLPYLSAVTPQIMFPKILPALKEAPESKAIKLIKFLVKVSVTECKKSFEMSLTTEKND